MELSKMTTEELDDIIKEVEGIKKPWNESLQKYHGVMADGAVLACDEVLKMLREMKNRLK